MIDKERITRQFVKLVSIDAPSYREREMADYLTKELEELGFSVEEDDAWKVYGGNCGNLYAHRPGSGSPLLLKSTWKSITCRIRTAGRRACDPNRGCGNRRDGDRQDRR